MEEQYAATIKEKVKEKYSKIALTGNSHCCMPEECCSIDESEANSSSPIQAAMTTTTDVIVMSAMTMPITIQCSLFIYY